MAHNVSGAGDLGRLHRRGLPAATQRARRQMAAQLAPMSSTQAYTTGVSIRLRIMEEDSPPIPAWPMGATIYPIPFLALCPRGWWGRLGEGGGGDAGRLQQVAGPLPLHHCTGRCGRE